MDDKHTIERAYELARSGTAANISDVVEQLRREGYANVAAHIGAYTSLRKELKELCRVAWAAAGNNPVVDERRP